MDTGIGFLLLILVLIPVIFFVMQPLNRNRRTQLEGNQALSTLMAERDHILNALRELDFDNSLGKIPEEEYPGQRANLVQHGAEVLKEIDILTSQSGEKKDSSASKDAVETYLASRRARTIKDPTGTGGKNVDKFISQRRVNRKKQNNTFCPHCGKPVLDSDRFCPSCGKTLRK